jgi:hypothetical protein
VSSFRTVSSNVTSSRQRGDRFTATGISYPSSSHRRTCRNACPSTYTVSRLISPVLSAIGMNSAGDTMPRTGWFQRTSASTPHSWCMFSETVGW